jgi:hypothetical protein
LLYKALDVYSIIKEQFIMGALAEFIGATFLIHYTHLGIIDYMYIVLFFEQSNVERHSTFSFDLGE